MAGTNGTSGARQADTRTLIGCGIFFGLLAIVLVVGAVVVHGQGSKSQFTQDHGVSRRGTVLAVHTVEHDTKYDHWLTYDYDVSLTDPVDGHSTTRLHDPSKDQQFEEDDTVDVLVDPRDGGYSELRGHGASDTWTWILLLALAVLPALITVLMVKQYLKRRSAAVNAPADRPA